MAAPDFDGWRRGFYLPTTADSGVVVLRKWLEDVAGDPACNNAGRAINDDCTAQHTLVAASWYRLPAPFGHQTPIDTCRGIGGNA